MTSLIFFFSSFTLPLMAISFSACVSFSFYVLFSACAFTLSVLTINFSFSLPSCRPSNSLLFQLPLAPPLSFRRNNIFLSPAKDCSSSCHGNWPHPSICLVSVYPFSLRPVLSAFLFPPYFFPLSLHSFHGMLFHLKANTLNKS